MAQSSRRMEVSFVNSINTSRGGTHVSYITDQAARGFTGIPWDGGLQGDFMRILGVQPIILAVI